MRIVVHDYAGHPPQVQLSRVLAARGHDVTHVYCEKLLTPRGALSPRPSDPPSFSLLPVPTRTRVDKTALLRRRVQELEYAIRLRRVVDAADPEVVLSANAPLDAQRLLLGWCKRERRRFVFWLQDLIGLGARRVLSGRYGRLGNAVGARIEAAEQRMLRRSDRVVAITPDFMPRLESAGVEATRCDVVPNWAPLEDLPRRPKVNAWSVAHGLDRCPVLLYSGTLGMKHDPALLVDLAERVSRRGDARVVVVSEGPGAAWLESFKGRAPANLLLLGFQPYEALADMLGTADVLLAILEPDAGAFSVPSKVLTSLCAARPLLLAVPRENLAARVVVDAGAGFVVDPRDREAFLASAERLLDEPELRASLGERARAYASREFDIERIASTFEGILAGAPPGRTRARRAS